MALFVNTVSADLINIRSFWIRMVLNEMTGILRRKGKDTKRQETHREEGQME